MALDSGRGIRLDADAGLFSAPCQCHAHPPAVGTTNGGYPMHWALGFATKRGIEILNDGGERITIGSMPVGNMHQPDPEAFAADFLTRIGEDDTVLSPSGPNYTYLPGAYARGANVFWIHPGRLNGVQNLSAHLLERFRATPGDFYRYEPQDARVTQLGLLTRAWINLERQRAGDESAYAQLLRRERDFFRFHRPDRDGWISRRIASEQRKFTLRLRRLGVTLTAEQRATIERGIREQTERLYASYFENPLATKDDKTRARQAFDELARGRLEWFGIEEIEAFYAAEVEKTLADTPENALFDGLISGGAVKTRAEVLTYLRNPLFYRNAGALHAYAGLALKDGQAVQRRRGEATRGNPEFRRALCFDFAEKYWQNDTVGFFRSLYYAYKAYQYYRYWDLMVLTRDAFNALGMSDEDAEEDAGEASTDGGADIGPLVARLAALKYLDLIARSTPMMRAVAELERNSTPTLLRKIFSRSPKIGGLNLQMTPARVERQVKRQLASTLLDAVYYRWLVQLGQPLPLAEDFNYLRKWRHVEGRVSGVPDAYDHTVVLRYFQREVERLRTTKELPADVTVKLVPKEERAA